MKIASKIFCFTFLFLGLSLPLISVVIAGIFVIGTLEGVYYARKGWAHLTSRREQGFCVMVVVYAIAVNTIWYFILN